MAAAERAELAEGMKEGCLSNFSDNGRAKIALHEEPLKFVFAGSRSRLPYRAEKLPGRARRQRHGYAGTGTCQVVRGDGTPIQQV